MDFGWWEMESLTFIEKFDFLYEKWRLLIIGSEGINFGERLLIG